MDLNAEAPAHEIPYVIFDFETTGLKADEDDIIEMGAVKIVNGEEVGDFNELINPLRPIPAQASAVNKIYDADVADKPTLVEVLPDFLRFIQGAVLVAHNAAFDCRFLAAALRKNKIGDLENYVMDTLTLSQKMFPEQGSHSLDAITKRYGIDNADAHRAVHDSRATGLVLKAFLEELRNRNANTFRQVAMIHGVPLGRVNGAKGGMPVSAYLELTSSSLF